jgi:protein-tyrosine phosphatase
MHGMIRLCFVCLGNICRSPTAEGIMHDLVDGADLTHAIALDSAGTGAYHVGEQADPRSRSTAANRGVTLRSISRQFVSSDFEEFDYVLAMDKENLLNLESISESAGSTDSLFLFRSFDPESPRGADVPDPYYGGPNGFDDVFDICEAACRGLLEHIQRTHKL